MWDWSRENHFLNPPPPLIKVGRLWGLKVIEGRRSDMVWCYRGGSARNLCATRQNVLSTSELWIKIHIKPKLAF
jgi:hypothetical protein